MSEDKEFVGLPVVNMTNFFNRELFVYSLGDVRLPTPVSIKKVGIFAIGVFAWTLPIFLIFGFSVNLLYLAVLLGPPVAISAIADKPWWNGRGIFDAAKVTVKFLFSDKCYTDFYVSNTHKHIEYYIEHYTWISRRRELQMLADIVEKRR